MMKHKGYSATVTFDDEAGLLHGEVLGMRDVITFQGASLAFRESVDDYLDFCRERGELADTPYVSEVHLHLAPVVQRELEAVARRDGLSVEHWVEALIVNRLAVEG
ncbi:MAG: type II toxin-antitoxin system HicB family antitoxin [Roseimicrobium sp.]